MTEQTEFYDGVDFRKFSEGQKRWFLLGKETGRKEVINALVELLGIQKMIDKSIDDVRQFSDDEY